MKLLLCQLIPGQIQHPDGYLPDIFCQNRRFVKAVTLKARSSNHRRHPVAVFHIADAAHKPDDPFPADFLLSERPGRIFQVQKNIQGRYHTLCRITIGVILPVMSPAKAVCTDSFLPEGFVRVSVGGGRQRPFRNLRQYIHHFRCA